MEILICVRQATKDDAESILLCLLEAFEPYRREYTTEAFADTIVGRQGIERRMKDLTVFVAVTNETVVGTIGCEVVQSSLAEQDCDTLAPSPGASRHPVRFGERSIGHIRGMAVLAKHQGAGIASLLLTAAEQSLKSLGCTRITLDTTEPLKRAQRFYEKNGYQPSGQVRDFYGMRLIELVKDISDQ